MNANGNGNTAAAVAGGGNQTSLIEQEEMVKMDLNYESLSKRSNDYTRKLHISSELGVAAAIEARRLAEKYGKDFLDCDDLIKIIGVGRNNIRQLLNSDAFPTTEIGNRKVVSVIAFAMWSLMHRNPLD